MIIPISVTIGIQGVCFVFGKHVPTDTVELHSNFVESFGISTVPQYSLHRNGGGQWFAL